jgi:hypothetical protein
MVGLLLLMGGDFWGILTYCEQLSSQKVKTGSATENTEDTEKGAEERGAWGGVGRGICGFAIFGGGDKFRIQLFLGDSG